MQEPLRWNSLQEAADWLAEKTGKPWTPRQIIDSGEQGLINIRAVLPPNIKQSTDGGSTYVGNTIKLDGVYLDHLLKHDSVYVTATCDVPMRRDAVEADIELTPPALITHKDLGVSRIDLVAAGEALSGNRRQASATNAAPTPTNDEANLSTLFDGVRYEALNKMFPGAGEWRVHAERADRNGLKEAAKAGRALFNPMLAALWWLDKNNPPGWDMARVYRTLANNLPLRSSHLKHLLTGDYD